MRHLFGKRKHFRSFALPVLCVFCALAAACDSGQSGSEAHAYCQQRTDSLWLILNQTRSRFNYRMDEIALRRVEMDSLLRISKFHDGSKLSKEDVSVLQQYHSILGTYKPVANKYKNLVLESEEHFFRVKSLDKAVKKGDYDNKVDEFKKEYSELTRELLHTGAEVEEVTARLNAVEPLYQRLTPKVDVIMEKISTPR